MSRQLSRQSRSVPKLRRHKASGRGYVVLNHRTLYLGVYDDPDTWTRYRALIATWENNGRQLPEDAAPARAGRFKASPAEKIVATAGGYTVGHLIRDYLAHARDYHGKKRDGTPAKSGGLDAYKAIGRLLRAFYVDDPVAAFGPLKLRQARDWMVSGGWAYKLGGEVVQARPWSRSYVNAQVNRIRRMFKWAVGHELAPASTLAALQAVEPLRFGKTTAREGRKVRPVAEAHVEAVMPFLGRQVAGIVRLMWLTGMRPDEVCGMRPMDLDTRGDVWMYRPESHKNASRGIDRIIPLGRRCQAVIRPFLSRRTDATLFSPAEAEQERRAARHAERVTPISCGNRPGTHRKAKRSRPAGHRYTPEAFRHAVQRACDVAFPPPAEIQTNQDQVKVWRRDHRFTPYQLRHAAGTRIRRETGGLEMVQVMLGHQRASTTEIYAEPDMQAAVDLARKLE